MTDINKILSLLSLEEQNKIKNSIANNLAEKICTICQNNILIPVRLNRPLIHCDDCGDESTAIGCLHCVRRWLQLNTPKYQRTNANHLICRKQINLKTLNAVNSYQVDINLMKLLDEYSPTESICICKEKFNTRYNY